MLLSAGADPEVQRSSKRRRPQDLARDLDAWIQVSWDFFLHLG